MAGDTTAAAAVAPSATAASGNGGDAPAVAAAPVVELEEYLTMTEEQRSALPRSRQKKLAKLADVARRKAAKAEAAASAPDSGAGGGGGGGGGDKGGAKKGGGGGRAAKKIASLAAKDAADAAAFVNDTPEGEKKRMNGPMAAAYQPRAVESAWYQWWEKEGFFSASAEAGRKAGPDGRFVMVIPPPNVTGSLHLGHTLMAAVEDTLTRWHRMHGRVALYVPGVDHAGIATQAVVEKKLKRERNITRHDLGREAFVAEVWKWKEAYGSQICSQLRRVGSSLDWSREQFTLSPKLSRAVTEAFCRLYNMRDGKTGERLVYRKKRLVHWCCKLRTALSNIEVDNVEIPGRTLRAVPDHDEPVEFGVLTNFSYRFVPDPAAAEGELTELVVATTRLETMLADVAVAIHPDDTRYAHLVGRRLQHPFSDRTIPVIADGVLVKMGFGTGAVKITPAHDANDFECGQRNNLPAYSLLNDDGRLNAEHGAEFAGMLRYEARVAVEKALDAKGLLRGKEPNAMVLGVCSRTGDVIEPRLLPQWYVNCDGMALRAVAAMKTDAEEDAAAAVDAARAAGVTEDLHAGQLDIQPKAFRSTWKGWLTDIHPWCISRQLWWGHRIPAYHVCLPGLSEEVMVVGRDEAEARASVPERLAEAAAAGNEGAAALLSAGALSPEALAAVELKQDDDVLDTWFSSGLFPFSSFGWPDEDAESEMSAFYPTTLLETGHDIIFFWVARMVMFGQTLTGKLPFSTVFLHPMVRDKYGRKMSKSLGNVVDPLQVIEGSTLKELLAKVSGSNVAPTEIARATEATRTEFPAGIPECGADALRFGLLAYLVQTRDVNLDVGRVVGYRNFCNKLWNAARFALAKLGDDFTPTAEGLAAARAAGVTADAWILSRLDRAVETVNTAFASYAFADAVTAAYNFWLYDLCDVYLELAKRFISGGEADDAVRVAATRHVLYECLDVGLRLLHPMMPFVTEELYQRLPGAAARAVPSIMITPFPVVRDGWRSPAAEAAMETVTTLVHACRSLKASYSLAPSARPDVVVVTSAGSDGATPTVETDYVSALGGLGTVTSTVATASAPAAVAEGSAVSVVNDTLALHMQLSGLVDFAVEVAKLTAAAAEKRTLADKTRSRVDAPGYADKVPERQRKADSERLAKYDEEVATMEQLAERMRAMMGSKA